MNEPRLLPSAVLRVLRRTLEAEIVTQPAGETLTLRRGDAVLLFAALADAAAEVEVLEESRDAADRAMTELQIARAEIERLQLSLIARDLVDVSRPSRLRDRARPARREAEVVDLTPILARERRDAGRPIGSEGGVA